PTHHTVWSPPRLGAPEVGGPLRGDLPSRHGPVVAGGPGTGKSHLALQLAREMGARVLAASPADLLASHVGDAEKRVAALFATARQCAPSLVVLEDIDALAPAGPDPDDEDAERDASAEGSETRVAYTLRAELDALSCGRAELERCRGAGHAAPFAAEALVLVVGTSRSRQSVAAWLLAPHRLGMTVELEPRPSVGEVAELLRLGLRGGGGGAADAELASGIEEAGQPRVERAAAALCARVDVGRAAAAAALCRAAGVRAVRRLASEGQAASEARILAARRRVGAQAGSRGVLAELPMPLPLPWRSSSQ
ncbi:unnamed protein product, partial [Prorocentrum cordatum]